MQKNNVIPKNQTQQLVIESNTWLSAVYYEIRTVSLTPLATCIHFPTPENETCMYISTFKDLRCLVSLFCLNNSLICLKVLKYGYMYRNKTYLPRGCTLGPESDERRLYLQAELDVCLPVSVTSHCAKSRYTTCYLSSSRLAHKNSTEFIHLFLCAAVTRASFHELHPASLLSFSTVRLQVVFWSSLFPFPSGAHVIVMLLWLFLSCLWMWPIIFHLCRFTSTPSGFVSAVSCNSSVVTCSSQWIRRICLRHLF